MVEKEEDKKGNMVMEKRTENSSVFQASYHERAW